ncbi:uncharacterized protein BP01DRAFT_175950 [Aspergillus saccharolyticus JOP 1030-1]|uniref:Uncharacterized protein n=1 Tax=Aspergillus saccharolyticus JOP 1030-1 TaxID=1450539 RepID=A0A318ZNI8_9EURO|nr:hypothetical protein BP01DRAFT_175950 [Aspergillus saccharolyticus JOP 1030-1]PYH48084.1 hypothetical protein BP01DRAFT_175950 [Aspergillus saccharolyticus JOP 1030-1]
MTMTHAPAALCHHDYTIGWISALPLEMAAATAMLDERHPDLPTKPNDDNTYILGRIHVHNVVIACLPAGVYGTTSAATIASQIRLTFPAIRVGLMVGIGGGVPGTAEDIRLGDVVVSKPTRDHGGIVQYDYGKSLAGGVFARQGLLNKPPPILVTAISRLQAAHLTRPSQISWLVSAGARSSCFAYPGADRDLLFEAEYDHLSSESTCHNCDKSRRVERQNRNLRDPVIHYGLIASANQVMKDGRLRDKLAQELGILCFEMEAAGLMDSFPCLVVRGICDYSDSHKSKEWQGYAAATAAAYTKELLSVIPAKQVEDEPSSLSGVYAPYLDRARSSRSVTSQRSQYDEQEELLEQISSYHYERVHRRLAHKRLAGTTQWFLDSREFKTWLKRLSNKLWCTGKIGSGKTVIAASVIEAIRYNPDNTPTIFFYCENDHGDSLRASSILSSLIRQLCEFLHKNRRPWPVLLMQEIRKSFGSKRVIPDFDDLKYIFQELFDLVPRASYVLDGLDALDNDQSKLLLTVIRSLFSGAAELQGQRIVLFSRDQIPGYVNIETLMPGIGRISTSDKSNTISDIQTYIDYSIRDKTMYRKLTDDPLLVEEVQDVLLRESTGMFLWVHLQLEILWSTCFTDAEVRLALRQLPKDLEETYRRCADRIGAQDSRALKVLKWVSFASRPLHLEELREAVAFEREDTTYDSNKLPRGDVIIGSCANLVVLDPIDLCVRFAHPSIKQYLAKNGVPGYQYSFDKDQGELECGEFCIAYLSFSNFSLQVEHKCDVTTEAVVPSPVLLAGTALNSSLRYFFRLPNGPRPPKPLHLRSIRTPTVPDRSQYRFLNYAISNWTSQTRDLTRNSPMWEKFEKLATCFNETWNFHPWKPGGRSTRSQLHSLFGWAVRDNHFPLLSIALTWKRDILQICDLPLVEKGLPALHVAIKLKHKSIIEALLQICNVNLVDTELYSPLHHAIAQNDTGMITMLLGAKDIKVDNFTPTLSTPLCFAARLGHYEVAELMINNGATVSSAPTILPLWWAANYGHTELVKLLVRHGASFWDLDRNGRYLLRIAETDKKGEMAALLRELARVPAGRHRLLILGAAESGKSTIVKQMKVLYMKKYTPEELALYRSIVYKNLLDSADALHMAVRESGLFFHSEEAQIYSSWFPLSKKCLLPDETFESGTSKAVSAWWHDPVIPLLMEQRMQFYLMDSAP